MNANPEPKATTERMVYAVASDTNPRRTYRVDLTALGGYGQCACKDWNVRRSPNIKAGLPMGTRLVCCKHVLRARDYFLNGLLTAMAKSESE